MAGVLLSPLIRYISAIGRLKGESRAAWVGSGYDGSGEGSLLVCPHEYTFKTSWLKSSPLKAASPTALPPSKEWYQNLVRPKRALDRNKHHLKRTDNSHQCRERLLFSQCLLAPILVPFQDFAPSFLMLHFTPGCLGGKWHNAVNSEKKISKLMLGNLSQE